MRISIMGLPERGHAVGPVLRSIEEAEAYGLSGYWLAHTTGVDALTVLALAGTCTSRIELGTFVVPTYPRHPAAMAQQALTTQSACDGRLILGIGLSHRVVMEGRLGFDWDHPIRHMREYLTVLNALLNGEPLEFEGTEFTVRGYAIAIDQVTPPDVVVAALGPQMLRLTGSMASGTALWMGGPEYIRTQAAPILTESAQKAGRPAPRIIAGLPVCVTEAVEATRERAAQHFQVYGRLPSYRAILDKEGASGPEDVALIGDEETVRAGINALKAAGATDIAGAIFASTDQEREATLRVLRDIQESEA
jgi:5,10-methylenetetrahydromethanopterin reductase